MSLKNHILSLKTETKETIKERAVGRTSDDNAAAGKHETFIDCSEGFSALNKLQVTMWLFIRGVRYNRNQPIMNTNHISSIRSKKVSKGC